MDKKEHREVWFSGEVQGVGFRAMAVRLANNHNVSGRVKNLEDGRVWLGVEGDVKNIESYLAALQKIMSLYIKSVSDHSSSILKNWEDFRIEY